MADDDSDYLRLLREQGPAHPVEQPAHGEHAWARIRYAAR